MQYRSRHWWCSIKRVFLKTLQNSQENNCVEASSLINCWLKKDSDTGVFLLILRNFYEHLFYGIPFTWLFLTVQSFINKCHLFQDLHDHKKSKHLRLKKNVTRRSYLDSLSNYNESLKLDFSITLYYFVFK